MYEVEHMYDYISGAGRSPFSPLSETAPGMAEVSWSLAGYTLVRILLRLMAGGSVEQLYWTISIPWQVLPGVDHDGGQAEASERSFHTTTSS